MNKGIVGLVMLFLLVGVVSANFEVEKTHKSIWDWFSGLGMDIVAPPYGSMFYYNQGQTVNVDMKFIAYPCGSHINCMADISIQEHAGTPTILNDVPLTDNCDGYKCITIPRAFGEPGGVVNVDAVYTCDHSCYPNTDHTEFNVLEQQGQSCSFSNPSACEQVTNDFCWSGTQICRGGGFIIPPGVSNCDPLASEGCSYCYNDILTCPSTCSGGACVGAPPPQCSEGELRCNPYNHKVIDKCVGGAWTTNENCETNNMVCVDDLNSNVACLPEHWRYCISGEGANGYGGECTLCSQGGYATEKECNDNIKQPPKPENDCRLKGCSKGFDCNQITGACYSKNGTSPGNCVGDGGVFIESTISAPFAGHLVVNNKNTACCQSLSPKATGNYVGTGQNGVLTLITSALGYEIKGVEYKCEKGGWQKFLDSFTGFLPDSLKPYAVIVLAVAAIIVLMIIFGGGKKS